MQTQVQTFQESDFADSPAHESIADRHNNPLNVKFGPATAQHVENGEAELGEPAQDGGQFLKFVTPEAGFSAAKDLLLSPAYKDLPLESAMRKWSHGGYGAEVAQGLPRGTKVSQLTEPQRDQLVQSMAKREGYSGTPRTFSDDDFADSPQTFQESDFSGPPKLLPLEPHAPIDLNDQRFNPPALTHPSFETPLTTSEEAKFKTWKQKYAPNDSGEDYDLRGAFKAGLTPDPETGHWPDTFKKPNHPTFSNESQYAVGPYAPLAGHWTGPNHDQFVPGSGILPKAEPTVPTEDVAAELQEPISKKILGMSLSDVADAIAPEGPKTSLAGQVTRRSVKTVTGFLDFAQSPVGLAAILAEFVSGGTVTPFLSAAFGAQAARSTEQALAKMKADRDAGKDWFTPENTEALGGALSMGALAALGPAGMRDAKLRSDAISKTLLANKAKVEDIVNNALPEQPEAATGEPAPKLNRAARREALTVPETTAEHLTDQELDNATRPEPETFTEADFAPEGTVAPPAEEPAAQPVQPVEAATAVQPEAETIPAKAETKPPEGETTPPATETEAPKTETPVPSALEKHATELLGQVDKITENPIREKEPEVVRNSEFSSYSSQIRGAVGRMLPHLLPEVDDAIRLHDEGKTGDAMVKLEVVRQRLHEEGRRLVEVSARNAGIEIPEKIPEITAESPAYDRIVEARAESLLHDWAETTRETREAQEGFEDQGRHRQDLSYEGQVLQDEQFKEAITPGSKGVKEGTPLEGLKEGPQEILDAEAYGKSNDTVKGRLYEKIMQRYRDWVHENEGELIRKHVEANPEVEAEAPAEPKTLFGNEPGIEFREGETKPLLGKNAEEAQRMTYAGRTPEQLREAPKLGSVEGSPLFGESTGDLALGEDEGDTSFNFAKAAVQSKAIYELGTSVKDTAIAMRDQIRDTFVPVSSSEASEIAGLSMRAYESKIDAVDGRAGKALLAARSYFRKFGNGTTLKDINPRTLAFFDAVETGNATRLPPQEQGFARQIRKLSDDLWNQVRQRSGIQTVNENYLAHMWAEPEKAQAVIRKLFSKRPLQGGKGFLKERTHMTIREGLEAGLKLAFENPIDAVLAQFHQESKFIAGHDALAEWKANGVVQFRSAFDKRAYKEGLTKIDDPLGTVYGKPTVTVREAYDEVMFSALNDFARSISVEHFRQVNIGQQADTWGYTKEGTSKVFTKFGGPETILTHELGHQLDYRYGLKELLTKKGETAKELRALADARYEGKEDVVDESYKKYVRQGSEKIANLIHAMIHAPELAQRLAPNSVQAIRELAMMNPELKPLLEIQPSLVLAEHAAEVPVGGMVTKGYWMAPKDAAQVINNHLRPGLAGGAIYDFFRATGNVMNQAQLGISGFHFTFTATDASASEFALGLQRFTAARAGLRSPMEAVKGVGEIAKGLASVGPVGVAPWEYLYRGNRILKAFHDPGSQGKYYDDLVKHVIEAGGGFDAGRWYTNSAVEKFWDAWHKGAALEAAWRAPLSTVEYAAKPIMSYWVPRLKLGAFEKLAGHMVDDLGTQADPHTVRKAYAQAWDTVDDRMGQLRYANLHWNPVLKDLGMASVRSLGWNLGTLRQGGGGLLDAMKATAGKGNAFQSGKFALTPRMGYVIGLPLVIGMQGAALMYLMTGKSPKTLLDYYYPQTGKISPTGEPERISMPSYMKDIYAYGHDFPKGAVQTAGHKLHPELGMLYDMLQNKDFFGTEIRHEGDPAVRQLRDVMAYMGKEYVPFSGRNLAQRLGTQTFSETLEEAAKHPGVTAASFFGAVPAPKSIMQSPAERLAQEYAAAHTSQGARTKEQFERSQLRNQIVRAYQEKDPTASEQLQAARKSGKLSPSDIATVQSDRRKTPIQRMTKSATLEELLNIWDKADPEEKKTLRPMIANRRGSEALTPEMRKRLLPRANAALAEKRP